MLVRELTGIANYVYTGTVHIYPDIIGVILRFANLFQLAWLFEKCIIILIIYFYEK